MRYEVPQFIDIEDKIFGPLTFKQALYVAGGVGMGYVVFRVLGPAPFVIKAVIAGVFLSTGLSLAFLKINKRPLKFFLRALFMYLISPKRYIWKKKQGSVKSKGVIAGASMNNLAGISSSNEPEVNRMSHSKIREMALSLDLDTDNEY